MLDIPLEAQRIILGAMIAIATSSLGAVLSHILQMRRADKEREHDLEDRQKLRKRELFDKRVANAEKYVNEMSNAISSICSVLNSYSTGLSKKDLVTLENMLSNYELARKMASHISVIGDSDLIEKANILESIFQGVREKIQNPELQPNTTDVSQFIISTLSQTKQISALIFKRLDELSAEY